jgi:phytoene synthase
LIQLAALIIEPEAAPRFADLAGHAGCAQAIAGLLLLLPLHRARGQCYVPADILASVGTTPEEFLAGDGGSAASLAISAMIALAREHMAAFERGAGALPESLRPAFLPLALTRAHINDVERMGAAALRESPRLALWRRHWLMFRRATRGW